MCWQCLLPSFIADHLIFEQGKEIDFSEEIQKRIVCVFYHKSEDVEYLQGDTKRLHAFMLRAAIRRMIVCWRFNGGNWYFQTPMPILKKTDNNLHCLHWAEIRQPQMASFCKISFIFVFDFLSPCNSYFARLEQTRASQQEGAEGGQQGEQPAETSKCWTLF